MKIEAAVLRKVGERIEIEEVEIRRPLAGEVLVKLRASGICHSDLSVHNGALPMPSPIILGHEGAGEVIEVGEGVTSVAVGDHVIINNIPECGKCRQCLSSHSNLCIESGLTLQTPKPPLPKPYFKSSTTGEVVRTMIVGAGGTWATHTIVSMHCVTPIPKDFPFEEAALIACGVMTGIGCCNYATQVTPGSSVAVFGVGSIGLNAIQGAKQAGATVVIALDILDSKEAIARQFGATHFINPSKLGGATLADRIKEIVNGTPYVDFAIEAIGNTTVLQTAASIVHPYWGVVVAVGIPHHTSVSNLPGSTFRIGRTIKGVYFGNAKPISAGKQIIKWHAENKVQIKPLITHRITLKEVNKGLELLAKGEAVRVVILYGPTVKL